MGRIGGSHLLPSCGVLLFLCLVGQASAQIPVTITLFGFSTPNITLYGQSTSFVATLAVDPGQPLPTGNLLFLNGNTVLANAPLATAGQASGNQLLVNFQPPFILGAALYNQLNVVYPGNTVTANNVTTTWLPAATRPDQPDKAFLILPASTSLSFTSSPFTLPTFTQSFQLLIRNVNNTNQQPQGTATVQLTRVTPFAQDLGTFQLVLTGSPTDPNLVIGTLPSSFDANILLPSPSNLTARFNYIPTTNFTQPFDLFVGIGITNVTVPAPPSPPVVPSPPPPSPVVVPSPPPPPGVVPPPPPPPGGVIPTIITLQVYWEAIKDIFKDCKKRNLIFTASVTGPTVKQVPTTGFIIFQLLPGNITVGQGGVLVDSRQGIATTTIVKTPKEKGIYGIPPVGQWEVVATYSGSADGVYLPSRAVAPLYIYETCDKYGKFNDGHDSYSGGSVLGAFLSGLASEGGSHLPVYGNGYGGKYPDGHYYPPGSYYNGDNQPYTGPGAYYNYAATGGIPAQTTGSFTDFSAVGGVPAQTSTTTEG